MAKDDKAADAQAAAATGDVENLRRESAGKDRKLTELQAELKAAQEQIEKVRAEAGGTADDMKRMIEAWAEVKAARAEVEGQAKAFRLAVEKGLPVDLCLRDYAHIDETVKAFEEHEQRIRKQTLGEKAGRNVLGAGYGAAARPQRGLTVDRLRAMGTRELSRIPDAVFDRLHGGAK